MPAHADENLYAIHADLTGSKFSGARTVDVLVDGARHTPQRLRELCAAHYGIPLHQVEAPRRTTRARFDRDTPS